MVILGKNNEVIYDEVFHESSKTFGLEDTVRIDKEKEFSLLRFMQEYLHQLCDDLSLKPVQLGKFTDNHVVGQI